MLGCAERKPMLRVVRLPEAVVEPAPVSLDTGHALDRAYRRRGWIAFTPNQDVWGLPTPFGEPPFPIARGAHVLCTGLDPETVWLRQRGASSVAQYDGVRRDVRQKVDLPGEFSTDSWLLAETRDGFLFGGGYDGGLYSWIPGSSPELLVDDVSPHALDPTGTTIACWRHHVDQLALFDRRTLKHFPVAKPRGARWRQQGLAFSPDGAWLALDLDYSTERSEAEMLARLAEIAVGRGRYEPTPHRLGIVRCADGQLTVSSNEYDNFANIIWSLDSQWIVFTTPFEPRGLWVARPAQGEIEWIRFKRDTPSLLCDISDLVS
jgi:hypothetical protein